MKNAAGGRSSKSNYGGGKSTDARKDRKSGTGMSGSPKKGGHGGKFTWAGGDVLWRSEIGREKEVVDAKDPNFVDSEEISAG